MEEQAQRAGEEPADEVELPGEEETLVSRLSSGDHPVEVSIRPDRTGVALREAIRQGHVFVRFTGTNGGTELGISIDPSGTDVSHADFDTEQGTVTLVGDLSLDFEPVRCVATIDLPSFSGQGHLELREAEVG